MVLHFNFLESAYFYLNYFYETKVSTILAHQNKMNPFLLLDMALIIKRTTSEDIDFQVLVALLDQDLRERDGEDNAFYAQFNKIDKIRHAIVAYQDEKAVACGAIRAFEENVMEVKRMFVRPENRRQGLAQAVLQALEIWATELHYADCILETGKRQPEAIDLYLHAGYQITPNYGQYAGIENSVCMKKRVGYW
jgi:putative acetyltransferase